MKTLLNGTILLLILVSISCTKEDDEVVVSKNDLLISDCWTLSDVQYDPPKDTGNLFDEFTACLKDDCLIFRKDSTGTFDPGMDDCSGDTIFGSIGPINFTWEWTNNQKDLSISIFHGDPIGTTVSTYTNVKVGSNNLAYSFGPTGNVKRYFYTRP